VKKRELSEFMTHELLYDYVNDNLDNERKKSLEEVLAKSDEARNDLHTIEAGISYLESLSHTKISTALIQQVSERVTYFGQIQKFMSFENWPPFVKWTLEAVLVISVVIVVSLVAPWGRFKDFIMQTKSTDIILAEIPKTESNPSNESLNKIEKDEKGHFEDESESSSGEDSTDETTKVADVTKTPVKAPEPPPKKVVAAAAVKTPQKPEEPKKRGFVYRGTLSIVNAEAGTTKLKEKIVELGGRKAGEVELGWKRNEGDYYFHFTIPESKLDELQEYFKTLGDIKLSKDPHPRVMPDGIVRMIITTEESK
jgi:hypothetical protein